MKTITFVAVVMFAALANAAQINWGLTGPVKYDNVAVGTGATFTLVCMNGITDSWSDYAGKLAAGQATAGVVSTKVTNASGVSASSEEPWGYNWAASTDISKAEVADGTVFGFLVTTVQSGTTYYWASSAYTVSESDVTNWNATMKKYTMSTTASAGPNNNWTAVSVPEPATGALALAGIALLFKRRKARA